MFDPLFAWPQMYIKHVNIYLASNHKYSVKPSPNTTSAV